MNLPDVLKQVESLIVNTIPVLEKSAGGWWKLAMLSMAFGLVASIVITTTKFNPNVLFNDRSPCQIKGDTLVCD